MNITENELREAVQSSLSYTQTLHTLGYAVSGVSHRRLKAKVEDLGIPTDHFRRRVGKSRSLEEILVKDSEVRLGSSIRDRILEAGLLEHQCQSCGLDPHWNGKILTLHLDHINGDRRDHRLENLRFLCPNCHSQTPTYAGKNNAQPPNLCVDCQKEIHRKSTRCIPCSRKEVGRLKQTTKINWPTAIELRDLVWSEPCTKVGQKLGVSDNAVRKRCRKLGIKLPPAGHFQKKPKNHCPDCGAEIQRSSSRCVPCFRKDIPWKKASPAGHDPALPA